MIKEITSVNNSFIKSIANLKLRKERLNLQTFLVEGYHLVNEANNHHCLKAVFALKEDDLLPFDCDKYLVTKPIIEKLSNTVNPQDIIGLVNFPKNIALNTLLKSKSLKVIILDDVNDPGNLGTIIRTAAALEYDAVISSFNTVDYYNDKTLRATQGSIFKINLYREDLISLINALKQNDCVVYGTSLQNSTDCLKVKKHKKFALVLGNEARGVSEEVLKETSLNIRIEMKKDVESLNVGIAGGILMWELSKNN